MGVTPRERLAPARSRSLACSFPLSPVIPPSPSKLLHWRDGQYCASYCRVQASRPPHLLRRPAEYRPPHLLERIKGPRGRARQPNRLAAPRGSPRRGADETRPEAGTRSSHD